MAKVPAKEPSLNDALQGDLFANALTDTTTKDLKDILSDGDNATANTKLKTKAKAKAKASAKAKSKVQAALDAKAESKSEAQTETKADSKSKSKAKTKDKNKAEPKLQAETKSEATAKSKGKVQAIAEANAESKSEAQTETKVDSKSKNKAKAEVKTDAQTKSHAKTKDKVKTKSKAKHQNQSLASGKDDGKSNEVLLDPSLELINNSAQSSNATATTNATAPALTKVKANKHAHHANKSQDKELVLGSNSNELSNRANMGLLTDTEQTLLSPLFSDVLSEQNILEESKDSLLTPHMSSLLEGQELEGQALESELKIVSCTEVNSSASASASASYSASANTSDSDSTSASSSESAQSQSDASNSDTSHSDTKGKSNESVKIELGLGALGSLGSLGANLPDGGEFELKVQTLQELEALDKVSGQDKSDAEDNNAKQGSLFLEGYVVGQGGLFDDVNDEVVNNNNDDIELVYVPLKEVSLQEKFSDVLAPSENLPELGEDESYSDVDIYAPQEPAFNFFEPSPDSLQASQFPSLGAEASTHTSAGGSASSASASTGANAEVKAMSEGEVVIINHEVESDSTMATKSQDDTKVKATATRKARASAKSRVKADSKDGTGAGADLVTQVGADAGADAEAGAGAGAGAKTSAKAKAKAKVVYEPYEYPIDPKVYAVCGIDEAGRGPLMGDVVAACVILDHNHMIEGLNDSKKLTEKARDALAPIIKEQAIAYGIGRASPQEIDSLNILNATFLAMRRAFDAMQKSCNLALIDGNKIPKTFSDIPMVMEAVVKGDARVAEISAASILAKTTRDADCYELDKLYPEYGFARHKGYPTKDHLEALANLPILPCYRKSYGPVKKLLAGSQDEVGAISPNVQKRLETAKDTKQKKLDELLIENTLISLDDFA